MGLQTYIGPQIVKSQLRNGPLFLQNNADSTNFFQANVGEFVKVTTTFYFKWFSEASEFSPINVQNGQLQLSNGDFITDGWNVGDTFTASFIDSSGSVPVPVLFNGTVDALVQDTMFFTLTSGSIPNQFDAESGGVFGTNILDASIFKYNLIENADAANYNSLIDGEPNQFFVSGLSNPIDTFVTATPSINGVNRTWLNGDVKIKNRGPNQAGFQEFVVDHTFYVLPYYLTGYDINYQNGTLPQLFSGNNSLKYIVEIDARPTVGNANASKVVSSTNLDGNVGFFNESFNGFPNVFNVSNFQYVNQTALNPSGTNTLTCTIQNNGLGTTFQNGDYFSVYFSRLVDPNDFQPNTRYSDQYLINGVTTDIGNAFPASNAIVQNVEGSLVGGDLVIDFEVNFTQAQFTNQILPQENYLIWVSVGSNGKSNQNDDRVNLILDFNQFNEANDVPTLSSLSEISQGVFAEVYNHNNQISAGYGPDVYDSFNGMVEDGYTYKFQLLTRQSVGSIIQNMDFNMIARNPSNGNEFILNSFNFDLSSSQLINSVSPFSGQQQYLNLDTTRGFNLSANDQFNFVKIETLNMQQIGASAYSTYNITIGFKINWETWIANSNVDIAFFDNSKPNNNLNDRLSNYSEILGYEIHPTLDVVMSNDEFTDTNTQIIYPASSTLYRHYLPKSIARDYGDDSTPKGGNPIHSCTITTQQLSTGNNTNLNVLTNEDTQITARFARIDGAAMGFTNYTGAIRIDSPNGGLFSIEELSTLADNVPISNGLLKPLPNETRTKLEVDPNGLFVDLKCLINSSNVQDGTNYVISSRLWTSDEGPPVEGKKMENNTQKLMEDGTDKIIE